MELIARRYDNGTVVRLQLDGQHIAAVEPAEARSTSRQLPWIAPGFFDLQVNGYGGQEFCAADLTVEQVERIVAQMLRFGTTQFLATVTTSSFATLAASLRTIALSREQSDLAERHLAGVHLEGPYISPQDGPRGAHPLEYCRPPDWDEFQQLQAAAGGCIRLVTLAPEYDQAPAFIARAVESGVVVAIGHTAANSQQISVAVEAGARLSTHWGNGTHPVLPRHPNYLWDQLADDRLALSLIADMQHLPANVLKTAIRAKTAARCILISDFSGLAGLPPGRHRGQLCDVDLLPDGRLLLAGQTQLLAGAAQPLGVGIGNVMRHAEVTLKDAIDMASRLPRELLGLTPARIAAGEIADLVTFNLADAAGLRIQQVVAHGRSVDDSPAT